MGRTDDADLFLTDCDGGDLGAARINSHRMLQEGQKEKNSSPVQANTASPALLRPV